MVNQLHSVPLEELQVHRRGNVKDEQGVRWRCTHLLNALLQRRHEQHRLKLLARVFVWELGHARGWLSV